MFTRPPLRINLTKTSIKDYLNQRAAAFQKKSKMAPFQSIDEKRTIGTPKSPRISRTVAHASLRVSPRSKHRVMRSMMAYKEDGNCKANEEELRQEIFDHEVLTAHSSHHELNDSEVKLDRTLVSQHAESPLLTNTQFQS